MKYFFLSEGWTVGRVWSTEGPWNEVAWRRSPHIERTNLSIIERGETLWLYRAEEAVVMLEVRPSQPSPPSNNSTTAARTAAAAQPIGQVVLRRLIDADQVVERLSNGQAICQISATDALA
ncbi:MAG: hypothetical protein MH825_15915 [Cyanobacteria bacterium]|nr:hypothetical protein [Cyanobacteriota bacterium]